MAHILYIMQGVLLIDVDVVYKMDLFDISLYMLMIKFMVNNFNVTI